MARAGRGKGIARRGLMLVLSSPSGAGKTTLSRMLLTLEMWEDVVPLLREQAEETSDEREKLKLLSQLAGIQDEKLEDLDAAFATCEEILTHKPTDRDTMTRMERIDERSGKFERLLGTLERRALTRMRSSWLAETGAGASPIEAATSTASAAIASR